MFRNQRELPSTILDQKERLLKELDESARIRERYFTRHDSKKPSRETISLDNRSQPQGVCVVIVDGAWKRLKNHHPRAGIGWSAFVNNKKVFEGKEKIIALTPLQTEAQAMLKGMSEAHIREFFKGSSAIR